MGKLRDKVCDWVYSQEAKHEYPQGDFAKDTVNAMSNYELLCAIDEAIEELLKEKVNV